MLVENSIWHRLPSLTLRSKILMMILPASIISMGLAGLIGYFTARDALTKQASAQLTAIRSAKKAQVESYYRNLRSTFGIFADDVAVVSATQLLGDGFNQLGRQKLAPERAKALEKYYSERFVPELIKTPGFEQVTAESLLPRTDRAAEAQALFITENPNKATERAKLVDHPVSNPYTLAHFTYHAWFKDLADRLNLYDLMIVSTTGNMIYSVAKEVDFASNLIDGPYATTNIGRLFRQVLSEHRKGYVKFADFEFYAASNGVPAQFIATPIYAGFKLVGVLIGQISNEEVSRTMNGAKSWRADGLGETGFAYIAGPSLLLRNDHRVFIENKARFFAVIAEQGMRPEEIETIDRQNTTVLRYKMNVESVRRAVLGETGVVAARNAIGQDSLQAYTPLNIPDLNWVLSAHITSAEIFAPLEQLKRTMMIVACGLTLLSSLLAMFMASRFIRPINNLMQGIDAIKAGRSSTRVAKDGDDEFGRLSDSFNTMATSIQERDDIIAGKNKAYAGLLSRVFPEIVADRMRSGQEQIIDTQPSVSMIYASVIGFTRETDDMSGSDSVKLLNEIIESFDNTAEKHGVERVKTVGEHYIAACGLTVPRLDHAARAVDFVDAIAGEINRIATERKLQLEIRASIASGRVHAGLVGNQRFVYDVWGRPLNLVRRLIHDTAAGEIGVTQETQQQLTAEHGFTERPAILGSTLGRIVRFGRPVRVKAMAPLQGRMAEKQQRAVGG